MTLGVSKSLLSCAVAALLLTACGGGGGGGSSSPSPTAGTGSSAPQTGGTATAPTPTQLETTPYIKASNLSSGSGDSFGWILAVSGDGNTLAVGAPFEDSSANTINGDQKNNSSNDSGAVFIYVKSSNGSWTQEAYIKAPNNVAGANFGESIGLSNDGSTLVVGAPFEDGAANTIDGNQAQQTNDAGAVYVFTRDSGHAWSASTYIKPSHNYADSYFGWSVAVSGDGSTIVAGAPGDSNSTATSFNHAAANSGAAYVFQSSANTWTEKKYLKASNAEAQDNFGSSVALSKDGNVVAVGAPNESSNGSLADNSRTNSGAVYTFAVGTWAQKYLKASTIAAQNNFGAALALDSTGKTLAVGAPYESSNALNAGAAYVFSRADASASWMQPAQHIKATYSDKNDNFGIAVALSGDGQNLVVGAIGESSKATGVNGDQTDNSMDGVGAAYLFNPNNTSTGWDQKKYLKPSTATVGNEFGSAIGISNDASTLVISGAFERSDGTSETNTSAIDAGAAWAFY